MIITPKILARYSNLPSNYDFSEIINYVPIAESIWVIPLIGRELYDEINEQVASNTLSDENATLLTDVLWQYLAFAVTLEALAFIWVHFSQVGITLGSSSESSSVSLKDITFVESSLRRQVETLKNVTLKWLCERQEYFPLFVPTQCDCGCGGGCSCGTSSRGTLKSPNKLQLLYTTPRVNTDIR